MVVLNSSKNKEAGMAFINYVLEAENQAWVAANIGYKVPNKPAMEGLDADLPASSRPSASRWTSSSSRK